MTDQPAVGAFAQSTFSSNSALGLRGFLQIWSLDVSRPQEVQRHVDSDYPDPPTMLFEGGLCVDAGEPWALKWCPRGGHVEQPAATSVRQARVFLFFFALSDTFTMGPNSSAFWQVSSPTAGSTSSTCLCPRPNTVGGACAVALLDLHADNMNATHTQSTPRLCSL